MAKLTRQSKVRTQLSRVTASYAPGYRDLTLILKDAAGKEYDLHLTPDKVQSLIYDIVDVVKQIGAPHPPIDWDQYPLQVAFPNVTPWMRGPFASTETQAEA